MALRHPATARWRPSARSNWGAEAVAPLTSLQRQQQQQQRLININGVTSLHPQVDRFRPPSNCARPFQGRRSGPLPLPSGGRNENCVPETRIVSDFTVLCLVLGGGGGRRVSKGFSLQYFSINKQNNELNFKKKNSHETNSY